MEVFRRSTPERQGQSNPESIKVTKKKFRILEKWYDPENEVASQRFFDNFHEFSVPQNSNPVAALHALEDINI